MHKYCYQVLLNIYKTVTFLLFALWFSSVQSSPVQSLTQSCLTLCDPMNCSTPGLPVHHQLLEFTQTHAHRVSDAIQLSHPLSSPSSPAPKPSQCYVLRILITVYNICCELAKCQASCLYCTWNICLSFTGCKFESYTHFAEEKRSVSFWESTPFSFFKHIYMIHRLTKYPLKCCNGRKMANSFFKNIFIIYPNQYGLVLFQRESFNNF